MSVDDHTLTDTVQGPAPIVFAESEQHRRFSFKLRRSRDRPPRPRVYKLRLLLVLLAFLALAGCSALFGMLTAVESDLPQLVPKVPAKNLDSYLYDETGTPIGVLAPPNQARLDTWSQISQNMVHAIVSVEDKRFWTDPGVDVKGLLRALVSDVTGGQYEGGSTIPEQFVKNVEQEQNHRTVFEKLREAGLAFQLVHKWPRWLILTDYLNTIYFGNGAYGIESAARVYFGWNHGYDPQNPAGENKNGCGDPDEEDPHRKECASVLEPWEAALLAGMVANPTEFDPILHPAAATTRRDQVLEDMYQQHYISWAMYQKSIHEPLPTAKDIQMPQEPAAAPYFTSWVRPLIINSLENEGVSKKDAEYEAFYGGLKINLTINLKLQADAQQAVDAEFPPGSNGPTASLVAIDNSNGEVRAMVSGDGDYNKDPFNLAVYGYRQPGSAFKMFTLAAAINSGKYGPDSVFNSKPLKIKYGPDNSETFTVHNFGNAYTGPTTLSTATAVSDNSVFTQLGMDVGTKDVAKYAKAMGIRTPISTNPAMIIGGLRTGVSALDMAHAYETAATGGYKVTNPILGDFSGGAIGIQSIANCKPCNEHSISNNPNGGLEKVPVLKPDVAATIDQLLHGPVDDPSGTGTAAAIPGVDVVGKTGTTSNYVDAWFVGWTPQMTVAVWVGYPNSGKPMTKNFDGGPVEGGTYPAIIWHNFMVQALQYLDTQQSGQQSTTTTIAPLDTTPASGILSSTTPSTSTQTGTAGATSTSSTTDTSTDPDITQRNGTATVGTTKQQTGGSSTTDVPDVPATTPVQTTPPVTTTPPVQTTPPVTTSPSATTTPASTGPSGGSGL